MTTTYTATSTLEILTTNLSTSTITTPAVTTLTIGLGNPATANMGSFVAKTIVITAPTSDQIAQFTVGTQVSNDETISTIAPASTTTSS